MVKLTEICRPKQWPTISGNDLLDSGYPVYGANGKIGFYSSFNHEEPTILITCRGATCGTINVSESKSYVTGNAMALDNLHPEMDLGFLAHYLRHRRLDDVISGTAQPQITREGLANLTVPQPEQSQQRRIAAILDQAEALRAKRRLALTKLDTLTQSLFLDMFGDPNFNHKGFQKLPLGDLIRLKSGEFLPGKNMAAAGKHPVYGGNGINGYHSVFMFAEPVITVGRVGVYCGVVHVTQPQSWVTDNALFVAGMREDIEPSYLARALDQANLNQYAGQAAQPLLSGSRIYPVCILVPPIALQREFSEKVAAATKLKSTFQRASDEVEGLWQSLSAGAFTGELL